MDRASIIAIANNMKPIDHQRKLTSDDKRKTEKYLIQ